MQRPILLVEALPANDSVEEQEATLSTGMSREVLPVGDIYQASLVYLLVPVRKFIFAV